MSLEIKDSYTFNKSTRKYIVKLKGSTRNIVISESKHKAILLAYSDWNGESKTLNEISIDFNFPRPLLDQYLKVFGISHATIPITDEQLEEEEQDILVDDLLLQKRFEIAQKFEKSDWRETQENSRKWIEFKEGTYDPFEFCLKNWKAPIYKPYKIVENQGQNSLIVCLSDLHYGAAADKKNLVRGETNTTDTTVETIKSYSNQILHDIRYYKLNINHLVILSLGDQLHTGNPYGTTTKGTPLRYDLLDEDQFDAAFNSLSDFIYQLSSKVPKTTIYSVKGNHFGVGDSILFKCLAAFFKDQTNIEFNINHNHALCFREKNLFCVASHGTHNSIKAKAPTGIKLQSYIQSLIINSQLDMSGITQRAAFFADLHHVRSEEFNDFEYFLLPSSLKGGHHNDALGLYSKARQQALLVDNKGIKSTLNYYF